MKFAFSTLGCPQWSMQQVAEAATSLGYQGVELRLVDGEVIPPDLPAADRRRVKDVLKGAGVEIACVDTSARFSSADREERRKHEEDVRAYLNLANEWESPLVRIFGGNLAPGVTEEQGIAYVAESLNTLAPAAERAGVTIALETHDAFSAGRVVAAVMERVPSSHVAVVWDTHHPYRTGESAAQTWDYIGKRVVHTHVKDARRDPTKRTGWQLVLLGQGEVPVREALATWVKNGYDGYVCVEWEKKWHPEIEEPEVAFPQHMQVLREYLSAIPA
ncbi:MAG TPA: sugar phosphate isomerase/epimerase family protein [Chloroflexota bacterium]|nr:sugar phosphate isomerase/epimerase family protein [Chloroflexota bacterium]